MNTIRQAMLAVIDQVPDEDLPFILSCDDCPQSIKVHCDIKTDDFEEFYDAWCASAWIKAAKELTLQSQISEWTKELKELRGENLSGSL